MATETRYETLAKSTHGYVGRRKTCGCIVTCVVDDGRAARDVAKMVRDDLIVERVPLEDFRSGKVKFGCSCKEEPTTPPTLFPTYPTP